MIVLDTDILSLLFTGHPQVSARLAKATGEVVTTIISRIEVLQGRFATLLKAADGIALRRGQERLGTAVRDLAVFRELPIEMTVADEFDRLRTDKKLRKMGRADMLIACIALAHDATLVTRNVRDFRLVPALKLENWAD